MEVNAEKGFAKYSKLVEDNPGKDNKTQEVEAIDKQREEKLVLTWFENNNPPNAKETQGNLKTLLGFIFVFLMIVTGLIAGLIVMDLKIKKLEHQNENLAQNLKAQENISQGLKAQNQNLSNTIEIMTNALIQSEFEIGELKEETQNLIDQNQKLIDVVETKHQNLDHYQKLHQNCSKEQELSMALIEDLKSQNQNLTKDIGKIDSATKSLVAFIPHSTMNHPLVNASKNGNIDQVKLFLDLGVNVNVSDRNHKSSLLYAAEKGDLELVKLLLKHGADPNDKDYHGDSSLYYATRGGHLEVVKLLLNNGSNVNAKNSHGYTPLHLAVLKGHSENIELLLQNGADVNAPNDFQDAPLHLAARKGNPKIVEILLKNDARKNVEDYNYFTPLMVAKYYKKGDYQQVIDLLQDN